MSMERLREDGRPFDAIDRLILHVGIEGPLSLAEAAMERHDALLAVADAARLVDAYRDAGGDEWWGAIDTLAAAVRQLDEGEQCDSPAST